MMNIIDSLQARGFVSQITHLNKLKEQAAAGLTVYLGIDPTFTSLHIGHATPVFMLRHLHNAGHKVILLMGGGTGRIGDPSGKTELRKLISYEEIDNNITAIKRQLSNLLNFDDERVIIANNADWLANLNYIDFLRDIGKHFSVNKMLSYEAYKLRLQTGLSFIEFNYQLLQSYDYHILNQRHGANLQIGGDDQWGNITAGIDLIRRLAAAEAGQTEEDTPHKVYGLTCPLITRADGQKMGKSEAGAIFLDKNITSPYDMYQYWRNVDDRDVAKFLKLYTFLPLEEITDLTAAGGAALNQAKARLAHEYVSLIHGKEEADKAAEQAKSFFNGDVAAMPAINLPLNELEGLTFDSLYVKAGLCSSKSEAKRLIEQGGAVVNEQKITDVAALVKSCLADENSLLLKAGKKKFARVVFG
ncbi:MAG: tyrosine--tRNA ligase [Spirochaetaceae bacterium]|nr:tyrosine--tRNA ligase [Spirochaetaceae bacterium]